MIVPARGAAEWVEEMVYSFHGQILHPGWRYELRIGVDGCKKTTRVLSGIGEPHWRYDKSVGPYIIRNSLVCLRPADAYCLFDADDIMLPTFLTTLLEMLEREGEIFAGPARVDWQPDGTWTERRFAGGVCLFPHSVWEKLGGFRKDRLSSDTDFLLRGQNIGIRRISSERPIFIRRMHRQSQTQLRGTGLGSPRRKRIRAKHKKLRKQGIKKIDPPVVELEEVR